MKELKAMYTADFRFMDVAEDANREMCLFVARRVIEKMSEKELIEMFNIEKVDPREKLKFNEAGAPVAISEADEHLINLHRKEMVQFYATLKI